jgi:ribosomal protein L4
MSDNKSKNAINKFLSDKEDDEELIIKRDGLIEKVDKIYVTNNGKQLLKEIYY